MGERSARLPLLTTFGERGANTVNWNLQNDAGRSVGNGLYLYELNKGSQVAQDKVSALK